MKWKNEYFGGAMKRLIKSILTILALGGCLGLAGNMLKGIAEVAADSNYSIEQKKTAFRVVAEQLEEQFQQILYSVEIHEDKND